MITKLELVQPGQMQFPGNKLWRMKGEDAESYTINPKGGGRQGQLLFYGTFL